MPAPHSPNNDKTRTDKARNDKTRNQHTRDDQASDTGVADQLALLIQRVGNQDQSAMATFYDQTINRVYGLVHRIIFDESLIGEVISDLYLQVWIKAKDYDPARGTVTGWLLMQARTRAIDALRKQHRTNKPIADEDINVASQGADTEQLVLAIEQGHALEKAICQLTPIQRQLITLAFYRDMTHSELAEYTRLPLGTVKSHLRRALAALREQLHAGYLDAACDRPQSEVY